MDTINIKGLNKAAILKDLYNRSKPQGLGFLHFDPSPMTIGEAENILKEQTQFDYLKGRVMKINLAGDELRTSLYDRDNGHGAAYEAIRHHLGDLEKRIENL